MWQDDYSENGGDIPNRVCRDAINNCEALTLGGYDDWRLPNIRELNSIIDLNRHDPAIDPVFTQIESSATSYYWSSTTVDGFTYSAWEIEFYEGQISYWDKEYNHAEAWEKTYRFYVRCIRGGVEYSLFLRADPHS